MINTKNKLIMECIIEHAREIRGGVGLLRKLNNVRKHKGALLSYEKFKWETFNTVR